MEKEKKILKGVCNQIPDGRTWQGMLYNKRKDNTCFLEKAVTSPVKNDEGKVTNFMAVKTAITRQKTDANEIEKQYSFSDKVIAAIDKSILIVNRDELILFANPAFSRITGFSLKELKGEKWQKVIAPKDYPIVKNTCQKKGKYQNDSYEIRLRTKSKKNIAVLVNCTPIIEHGRYHRIVAVITDIRKIKKQEKELKTALKQAKVSEKLKSAFLANMSHEIRTPLNAILGFAQILKTEQNLDKEVYEKYLDIIENKGNELLNVMSDIVDAAKIQSKIIKIYKQEFELNGLLTTVYNLFIKQLDFNKKHIKLKLMVPDQNEKLWVNTDAHWLSLIIRKLLDNAFKFTKEGNVELGYDILGPNIRFFVRDTGIGISKKDKKKIFKQFCQAENEYSRNYSGTGIGLNICKDLTRLLGGKIWVESELGVGSCFFFTINHEKE